MALALTADQDQRAPDELGADGPAAPGPGGAVTGAVIKRLSLNNYRSYSSARIDVPGDARPVILTGENGAGKTNILEALSFLSPGSGLRRAGLGEVSKVGGNGPWAVASHINMGDDTVQIGTGLLVDNDNDGPQRRVVRVDGCDQPGQTVLSDLLSVIWLTPQMDRLFTEGASSRRRFFDRMVLALHGDHGRQVGAFERAMRERNKILSDFGAGADPVWLNALEARMAEHGIAVATARLDYAGQLAGQLAAAPAGAFPQAQLALDGWLENRVAGDSAPLEIELEYREALKAARSQDAASGRAAIGAHKVDLLVTHTAKGMIAGQCSTGEQKALLISLILAGATLRRAVTGAAPLVLLDEVAAHLDETRRAALFDALIDTGSQCWMTGTDTSLFDALVGRGLFFKVADGKVVPDHTLNIEHKKEV